MIFRFNNLSSQTSFNSRDILGGKGANLAQMAKLKLPVPPGFTISTKVCEYFYKNNKKTSSFKLVFESRYTPLEIECKEFIKKLNETNKKIKKGFIYVLLCVQHIPI